MGLTNFPNGITSQGIQILGATTIPTAATAGYAPGTILTKTDASAGQSYKWINIGTVLSCLFVPTGEVAGYGILAAGGRGGTNTATTEIITGEGFTNTDIAFAGHVKSDDDDFIASVAMTDDEGEMLITASADPSTTHGYLWAALRNRCTPGWDVVFAGTALSTVAATTAITVTGVLATDLALACYQVTDDVDSIEKTVCTANTITVSHSAISTVTHTIGYCVLRARGSFAPSHYVFDADFAVATTADDAGVAENSVTVAGALTTDVAFVVVHTQAGVIGIARAQVLVDGTLTVQFSADPSTTCKFSWMLLRAY